MRGLAQGGPAGTPGGLEAEVDAMIVVIVGDWRVQAISWRPSGADPATVRARRRRGGAFLDALVHPFRDAGRKLETVVVYDPISPSDGVCTYVRDHPAALLAVSSHARTGLARIVWGSTAAAIVNRSASPVLVVPRVEEP